MKVLHYFLGFPPYRSGGLTKYAFSLMKGQVGLGENVYALWPGKIDFFSSKVSFKLHKTISGIKNIEFVNPLPVPLDEGVKDFRSYTKKYETRKIENFLESLAPNVIHIHTLMGLPQEFIEAANLLGIRTVFTSHDYFGLCPKVNFFTNGHCCDNDHQCCDCVKCNRTALSIRKIRLLQSPLYRGVKNLNIVRYLRAKHRSTFFSGSRKILSAVKSSMNAADYQNLREYYISMLSKIDCIHFNSTQTKSIYEKFFIPKSSIVLPIMHSEIRNNCKEAFSKLKSDKLRLTYLAQANPIKGFEVMRKALDELWNNGFQSFELNLFCSVQKPSPYMRFLGTQYTYTMLKNVFSKTDYLLVPSVCYETFGFVVLEALSYGVPVIVSDHVGAKDIIGKYGFVFESGSIDSLKKLLLRLVKEDCPLGRFNDSYLNWTRFLEKNREVYVGG